MLVQYFFPEIVIKRLHADLKDDRHRHPLSHLIQLMPVNPVRFKKQLLDVLFFYYLCNPV